MRTRWLSCAISRSLTLTLTRPQALQRSHCQPFSSSPSPSPSPSPSSSSTAVKKVTRSNFDPAVEDLTSRIRDSDFVAVDLEMTGVKSAPWRDSFEFDRSDVRYLKVKDSAEKFAVVQVGVCPFQWDASKGSFIAHPHNFYIFPRKELPIDGLSYEFLCQTTSIDFLAKYQFDFNAWIHEGVSYLSREQEVEATQKLTSAYGDKLSHSMHNTEECIEIPTVSTADLLFTERMKIMFREWHDGILSGPDEVSLPKGSLDVSRINLQTVFFKMRPALELDGFSSHQLNLIKMVLRKHFKDLVYVQANCENLSWEKKVVYTDSEEDKVSLMKEIHKDQLRSIESKIHSAVGFRHVIDVLASEQKLIVGHNCFLDIAHIYSKFIGPLPSSMSDFTSSVHKIFPHIVDTKHLMNASRTVQYLMKNSRKSLSSAFSILCPKITSDSQNSSHSYVKVEVQEDETGSAFWNSGAKHEAGYDAFMTGCVFVQSCSHLGIKFTANLPVTNLASNDKLKNCINLLHPSWNSGTMVDLSTGMEIPQSGYKPRYPTIVFQNIALIWGFPSKLKPKDVKECICQVFGQDSVKSIFFLDTTAALVQFSKEGLVEDFLALKDTLERNDDPISVLHPLSKILEGGRTRAGGYDVYREICGSSSSKVLFADQAETMGFGWKTKVESEKTESEQSESKTDEEALQPSIVKRTDRKKIDRWRRTHQQVSCEDILDSLRDLKPPFRKPVGRT